MNGNEITLVKALLNRKKFDAVNEYTHILQPEKGDILITEYAGSGVRVYKDKDKTRVLYPKDISIIQEGHVAEAIANGTIFDDAEDVDKNAEMIERTTIPYDAMINEGKNPPKHLKPMIAIIIGKMDCDGSCAVSDADRTNGINFVKDLVDTKKNDNSVNDVVNHYIDQDSDKPYGLEMGKELTKLDKEVDDIADSKAEDVISDDDTVDSYDDIDIEDIEAGSDDTDDPDIFDEFATMCEYFDYDGDGTIYLESKIRERDKTPRNEISQWMDKKGYWYTGDNPKKKKECMRMYHFLQQYKFDPKDETVEADFDDSKTGNKKRIKFKIDDFDPNEAKNGKNRIAYNSGFNSYHSAKIFSDGHTEAGSTHVSSKRLKGKQYDSGFTTKHEEGHGSSYEGKTKDTMNHDVRNDAPEAKAIINKYKSEGKNINSHDDSTEELMADAYAAKNTRIRTKNWGRNKETRAIRPSEIEAHIKRNIDTSFAPIRKCLDKWKMILKTLNHINDTDDISSAKDVNKLFNILINYGIKMKSNDKNVMTDKQIKFVNIIRSKNIQAYQKQVAEIRESFKNEDESIKSIINDLEKYEKDYYTIEKAKGSTDDVVAKFKKANVALKNLCEEQHKDYSSICTKLKSRDTALSNLTENEIALLPIANAAAVIDKNINLSGISKETLNEFISDMKSGEPSTISKIIKLVEKNIDKCQQKLKKVASLGGNNTNKPTDDGSEMRTEFAKRFIPEYDLFEVEGVYIFVEGTYELPDLNDPNTTQPYQPDITIQQEDANPTANITTQTTPTPSTATSATPTPTYSPTEGTDAHGNVNNTPIPMSAQTKANLNTKNVGAANSHPTSVAQEGFLTKKPKKLKPIPRDTIAYITCEMNDIHSANDQAMLAGYTCSKIELVDFYIVALDTQDPRYIVPHNRTYLVYLKTELEKLLAQILRIRPINRSEQIWRINYPNQMA